MENATKALLIAAAILIAIIIISFGIFVVRQGQEAIQGADLSEAEAAQFNAKFLSYEGNNVSTAQINALLNAVLIHNKNEEAAGTERYVSVTSSSLTTAISLDESDSNYTRVTGSNYYKVTCSYEGTRINSITITKSGN